MDYKETEKQLEETVRNIERIVVKRDGYSMTVNGPFTYSKQSTYFILETEDNYIPFHFRGDITIQKGRVYNPEYGGFIGFIEYGDSMTIWYAKG